MFAEEIRDKILVPMGAGIFLAIGLLLIFALLVKVYEKLFKKEKR